MKRRVFLQFFFRKTLQNAPLHSTFLLKVVVILSDSEESHRFKQEFASNALNFWNQTQEQVFKHFSKPRLHCMRLS
jgi:hypothetical protein